MAFPSAEIQAAVSERKKAPPAQPPHCVRVYSLPPVQLKKKYSYCGYRAVLSKNTFDGPVSAKTSSDSWHVRDGWKNGSGDESNTESKNVGESQKWNNMEISLAEGV